MSTQKSIRRRIAATTLTTGALLASTMAIAAAPAAADPVAMPNACSQQGTISKTLASGTAWYLCWNIDSKKGLVLESIYVKAPKDPGYRRVLDSIALAQLNVPYDSGQNQWNDITAYGFGNQYLQKLGEAECPNGELIDVEQAWLQRSGTTNAYVSRKIPAICVQEESTGQSYRSHEQGWGSIDDAILFTAQSTDLVVSAVSKVDWYEYKSQYRFSDTGTITAGLGATGDISPMDFTDPAYGWPVGTGATDAATSHHHSGLWRVDFGVDGSNAQKVRQFDSAVTGTGPRGPQLTSTVSELTKEANIEAEKRRFFEVYAPNSLNEDQHPRGYELVFGANDPYEGIPATAPVVSFTQSKTCEEFATQNQNPNCALQSVLDYTADQQNLTNPIAWVNVGFHHVVRDEDQSPMPIHWQGFSLVARDFWAQNPLTPTARDCINGNPGGGIDSTDACGHATGTALSLSAATQRYGTASPVSATVSVTQLANEGKIPRGTVSITDGASLIASGVPVAADGTAQVPLPAGLAVGRHLLGAVFAPAPDSGWLSSSSPTAALTVTPATTRTSFSFAKATVTVGTRARVNATVTGARTGFVRAYVGTTLVGSGTLTSGKATFLLKRLGSGTYTVRVRFVGSAVAAASTSPAKTLKVVR